jgi:hypothetical protein
MSDLRFVRGRLAPEVKGLESLDDDREGDNGRTGCYLDIRPGQQQRWELSWEIEHALKTLRERCFA